MSDETLDWRPFAEIVSDAAAAAKRPKSDIRTFLYDHAQRQGVGIGVHRTSPDGKSGYVAIRLKGRGAVDLLVNGVAQMSELWPLLADEFGISSQPLVSIDDGGAAVQESAATPFDRLLALFMRIGNGEEFPIAYLRLCAWDEGIEFSEDDISAAYHTAIVKKGITRPAGAPKKGKRVADHPAFARWRASNPNKNAKGP